MGQCYKCNSGFRFDRNYNPEEFIEGNPNSQIWIIGINPKGDTNEVDIRNCNDLIKYDFNYDYFKDFKYVSEDLFYGLKNMKVAHTDLIKCYSNKFPPEEMSWGEAQNIIEHCKGYLKMQLEKFEPKILICNGASVCKYIKQIIDVDDDQETYYIGHLKDLKFIVILCGFIGRIDNFSKRRLGKEIEQILSDQKIVVKNK